MSSDLTDIAGIGKAKAEQMKAEGIDSIEKLANLKLDDLIALKIKGVGEATALKYINNAKELLNESGEKSVEKSTPQTIKKPKSKKESKPKSKKEASDLKQLMKKQAECNIGLVGHVDHGKTTLIKALTGDWTDRHSEEQDLCPECDKNLEFSRSISFVDAPGHEILMATMLSGASLMDGACLLIAADEKCPQPQSREHLAALNIAGIKNIIIIQNKIDAVSREQAVENYNQIKEFVKGTVAENAPIIPISAVFGANLKQVIRAFEEIIPTPKLKEGDFQFLIARSFDINRPGKKIENLKGGVIGGSVLKGDIEVGHKIEIRPGIRIKDKYHPITSTVVSINQGNKNLKIAKPGGLIGLGTKLDPSLTKGDHLIGNLVGKIGTLPEILTEVKLKVNLLDRVIGSEQMIRVHPLKHNEKLLLVVGTEKTGGLVTKILKNSVIIKLTPPICPAENFIYAISRIINRRYRLIGYGEAINK